MSTRNRRQQVMAALTEHKTVYVKDLATAFDVSDMTIRRDLHRLAELGTVTLIHGGAVLNEGTTWLPTIRYRSSVMSKEKNAIAQYCSTLIKEGNAIYLDTGTTAMEIAEKLRMRQNIAVLTHSLPVFNILADADGVQLISMPGIYSQSLKGFVGDMTCRLIRNFRIDIAFFGISAIDSETGIMTPDMMDQAVKMAIMERAAKKIIVCDHTKIGQTSFVKVSSFNSVDMIVSDKITNSDFLQAAKRQGVEVIEVLRAAKRPHK